MFKLFNRLIIPCVLLMTISAGASELTLLSNNVKPGKSNADFPAEATVQPTQMKAQFNYKYLHIHIVTWLKTGFKPLNSKKPLRKMKIS